MVSGHSTMLSGAHARSAGAKVIGESSMTAAPTWCGVNSWRNRLHFRRICRAVLAAAAIIYGIVGVSVAEAQTIYNPDSTTLQVQVAASVGGRCGFADGGVPTGTFNQADFDQTGFSHDFIFTLDCTGPSRMAVVSSNGGLKTAGTVPTGYTTTAPYDVALHLVANDGVTTADASCAAATLASGSSCSFVGPASTSQGLRLTAPSTDKVGSYLRVSAPAYAGSDQLAAGTYVDTLTVTLSAAP